MRKCMRDCRQATRRALRTLALSCIFFSIFHATEAQVKSLQSPVSVSGNNISLLQVFRAIKKQTGFTLVYNNQLLDDGEKLNLNFKNAALQEVLDFVFKNKGIIYQLRSNRIVLDRKAPETTPAKPNIAQEEKKTQTVKGQVMDPEGNPIPGATVSVNGTPDRKSVV